MKNLFLARWQLKGRTPQSLSIEWQNLKFDPADNDINDFCNDVKNLTNRLGYPEDAQVMVIISNIPPMLLTQIINITTFRKIRDTLITLVENPVIKRVLKTEGSSDKGIGPFHMFQTQWKPENDAGMEQMAAGVSHNAKGAQRTPKSLGKILNKIDDLDFRLCKISSTDSRSWELPYNPQVVPPQHRGG